MTLSCRMVLVVVIPLSAMLGGCQKKGMAPVQGTVTYRGQPLPKALVVFMPETPDVLPASGMTDSDGRYELMTIVQGDGATIGKHRVTIEARAPAKDQPSDMGGGPPEQYLETGAPLIPEKYFQPDSSGLTAEVKPSDNTLDFELTDN